MNTRQLGAATAATLIAALLAILWIPANSTAGAPVPACNASTCPDGCCNADEICVAPPTDNACGTAGASCINCVFLYGDVCYNNACAPCDATTCPTGCCSADGACQVGTDNDRCGTGGVQCQNCASNGLLCTNQQCEQGTSPGCNSTLCPTGCCLSDICVSGTLQALCGDTGATCVDCALSDDTCVSGVCEACNASTCPNGCCTTTGWCRRGTADALCGTDGATCTDCSTNSQVCVGHACVAVDDDDDNDDNDNDDASDDDDDNDDDNDNDNDDASPDDDDDDNDNDNDDASPDDDDNDNDDNDNDDNDDNDTSDDDTSDDDTFPDDDTSPIRNANATPSNGCGC